jgi:hypothetical protein
VSEAGERALPQIPLQLASIEEVELAPRVAEEEPAPPRRAGRRALLQERARNGAIPVPGPIMTIGAAGSPGSANPCARCTYTGTRAPRRRRSAKKHDATP